MTTVLLQLIVHRVWHMTAIVHWSRCSHLPVTSDNRKNCSCALWWLKMSWSGMADIPILRAIPRKLPRNFWNSLAIAEIKQIFHFLAIFLCLDKCSWARMTYELAKLFSSRGLMTYDWTIGRNSTVMGVCVPTVDARIPCESLPTGKLLVLTHLFISWVIDRWPTV